VIDRFKSLEDTQVQIKERRVEESKFTWEKASSLLSSWKILMKEGCISEENYLKRRRACEGIPGMTDPCPNNYLREKDGKHFCGSCGCGHREMATLYVEGEPLEKDTSIRLWMPTANCPKGLHKDAEGEKTWKPIGGKIKQLAKLAKAALSEIGRFSGTSQDDAVVLAQSVIEDNTESESEINDIVKIMEKEESNEANQEA